MVLSFGFVKKALLLCSLLEVGFSLLRNSDALQGETNSVLQTQYISVSYDDLTNTITGLSADFEGKQNFQKNVLALPLSLEVIGNNQVLSRSTQPARVKSNGKSKQVTLLTSHTIKGVSAISEEINISIEEDSRQVNVAIKGTFLEDVTATAISYGVYVNSPSLYGLYSTGVVQMMGKPHACLGSTDSLERAYFLGDGSALDVLVSNSNSHETVLISSSNSEYSYRSGLQHVLFGQFPHKSKDMSISWTDNCWDQSNNQSTTITIPKDTRFELTIQLIPNNYDFPAYLFKDIAETEKNIPLVDLRTSMTGIYGSAVGCLQSYYTKQEGIIAPTIAHPDIGYSPDTNFFDPDNFITLSAMLYSGDVYLVNQVKLVLQRTSQTMCGIGSDTLAVYCNQSRQRTKHSQMMHFSYYHNLQSQQTVHRFLSQHSRWSSEHYAATSRAGQLMHHFVDLIPTYESIAGSEQLGPNIFWTMTVWKYLSVTQDYAFALEIFPYIDLSCKFILSFIDKDLSLINAPGPLWIDVLVREQYTSDSNAMIVPFLSEMIGYYRFLDRYSTTFLAEPPQFIAFVGELTLLKEKIIQAYQKYLWISNVQSSNTTSVNDTTDHFVTQVNRDLVSYRDFIDYDSNLMAVAFQIVTKPDQIQRIIQRVDSGPYTHVRATWCSEIPYSGDAEDCYIVGGSVCGDSIVTLARIGYIDGIARKQIGDIDTYQRLLLQPLQEDLMKDVWLYERYDANGSQIRTAYYFEYPSLIALFVREISFGLEVKLNEVVIHPFTAKQFTYHIGQNLLVSYEETRVMVKSQSLLLNDTTTMNPALVLPKKLSIFGLKKTAQYALKNSCVKGPPGPVLLTNEEGVLQTELKLVSDCAIEFVLVK